MDQRETQIKKLMESRPQLNWVQAEKIVDEIIKQTEKEIIEGESEGKPKGLLNCMKGEKNVGRF